MKSEGPGPFPIDGQPLLLAGAKASLPPSRLPELLAAVQRYLSGELETYRRSYERIYTDDDRGVFVVPTEHWESIGEACGLDRRETDGVRRAHVEQFRRLGSKTDRREEFETTLEIRSVVVIGCS